MKFIPVVAAVIVSLVSFVLPQTIFPPTIKIPVTFYDFHADGSNPEFKINPESNSGLHTGMVAAMLDSQGKPALGPTPYYNCQIAKWFKPWTIGSFTIPNYTNPATTMCTNPLGTVNYDTAFKNIVIYDTLNFTLVAGSFGTFEYANSSFFPLDGRGFGNEVSQGTPRMHNYSFSMEMHWEFMYKKGLTFNFEGDDLWIFINGRLAGDLGGIQGPQAALINLDSLPGLTTGKPYMLDVFYAQRHVQGSDIRITTDIIAVCPCEWELKLEPRDTIVGEGDSVVLHAFVMDDTGGIRLDVSSLCEWSLSPATTASFLSTAKGSTTTFYTNAADQSYYIIAQYTGPALPVYLDRSPDSVKIYVKPAPASNRIERIPVSQPLEKSKTIGEFYNLRGQKLQGTGTARVDGIVLERFIDQGGKVLVKRSVGSTSP